MKSKAAIAGACLFAITLSGCAEVQFLSQASKEILPKDGSAGHSEHGNRGLKYKVGKPYKIKGTWYYPKEDYSYVEQGIASWYGPNFHGKRTANGAVFDMNKVSAAHRTLPLPSVVRVTNLENGRSLKVIVNDRGPYAHSRIIDLSKRAAQLLGYQRKGTALVRVEVLEKESRELVAAMNGRTTVASDQPPLPEASPSIVVKSESLAPPPGVKEATPQDPDKKIEVASNDDSGAFNVTQEPLAVPQNASDVSVVAVPSNPQIFVQAGAFSNYTNAVKTKARLSVLGPTLIEQINKAERPLFRVRVGPFSKVEEADKHHEAIIAAGYPDARIVVLN
ncbi:septal ring lytic transglycosylase RlpA family protein [Aestuariispira ectoiniformans]|uniref:septal ring lytic transglycosylase RlpA family protein n=1 Tax=Aestuariispira ectoiniformans TaxID=2775080 RepID=UPI00223C43E0|nr:septal ring lytic transglycosylase RlpA family protein [Aestuariispira ectoiniformans]